VKDNFKVAGNTKERDATKTLLEEHMMTIWKQGMDYRFVFTCAYIKTRV
jgi:hypothetical protein